MHDTVNPTFYAGLAAYVRTATEGTHDRRAGRGVIPSYGVHRWPNSDEVNVLCALVVSRQRHGSVVNAVSGTNWR